MSKTPCMSHKTTGETDVALQPVAAVVRGRGRQRAWREWQIGKCKQKHPRGSLALPSSQTYGPSIYDVHILYGFLDPPPLCPQNIYWLSAIFLQFFTPPRLLRRRHMWNPPFPFWWHCTQSRKAENIRQSLMANQRIWCFPDPPYFLPMMVTTVNTTCKTLYALSSLSYFALIYHPSRYATISFRFMQCAL